MAIDAASYIEGLDVHVPADTDNRSEGAGQIRAIKSVLKRTFPHLKGEYAIDTRPFIPVGFITMYGGPESALPEGWAICDGRTVNGERTPDLRGRFIMGATASEKVGSAGGRNIETNMGQYVGTEKTALKPDDLPAHQHEVTVIGSNNQTHNFKYGVGPTELEANMARGDYIPKMSSMTSMVGGKGDGHDHTGRHLKNFDVRPAYFVLAYIMYVGLPE